MLRKLRAIWQIIISDQYKVYTYRFSRSNINDEYMNADYATWTFSDDTEAINRFFYLK